MELNIPGAEVIILNILNILNLGNCYEKLLLCDYANEPATGIR